jgi:uncharacterized protein YkwD
MLGRTPFFSNTHPHHPFGQTTGDKTMPKRFVTKFAPFLVTLFLSTGMALACSAPSNLGDLRAQVIAEVNAQRGASGLPALQQNDRLENAAQSLACDNAARQIVSHQSADGTQLQGRLRNAGYRYRSASENTQMGADTPADAVGWWMGSSGHRANILTRGITEAGVGVAVSDGRLYWVVNFGAPR